MESDEGKNRVSEKYHFGELMITWLGHVCQYRCLAVQRWRDLRPEEMLTLAALLNQTVRVEMECREIEKAQKLASSESKIAGTVLGQIIRLTTELGLSDLFQRTRDGIASSKEKVSLKQAIYFQAIDAESRNIRGPLKVYLHLERQRYFGPPHEEVLFTEGEALPSLGDSLYLDILRVATKTWEECYDEFQDPFSLPDGTQRLCTVLQSRILQVLDGRAMTGDKLAEELRLGDKSQLFKKGGINELKEMQLVKNDGKMGGYYRPDAPPENLKLSSLLRKKKTETDGG